MTPGHGAGVRQAPRLRLAAWRLALLLGGFACGLTAALLVILTMLLAALAAGMRAYEFFYVGSRVPEIHSGEFLVAMVVVGAAALLLLRAMLRTLARLRGQATAAAPVKEPSSERLDARPLAAE